MNTWEPGTYHEDPTVNALLNIAASLAACAAAQRELLYALKPDRDLGAGLLSGDLDGLADALERRG